MIDSAVLAWLHLNGLRGEVSRMALPSGKWLNGDIIAISSLTPFRDSAQ